MIKKPAILKVALLGLCVAASFRTASADSTNATKTAPLLVAAAQLQSPRSETALSQDTSAKPSGISFASSKRKRGLSRFSDSDDDLGRHFSRFRGPLGPTLSIPGATFVRGSLTPAQLGQLFSESVEIGEGEVLYDFPPGTAIRKIAVSQPQKK